MTIYSELDRALLAKLSQSSAATVEPFNDQYRNTEKDVAKAYPATYFELIEPINYSQAGNDYQQATMRARVHCVVYDIKDSKAKIHAFGQEIFQFLKGQRLYYQDNSELTSPLVRVSSSLAKRYKNLKVLTIDFEFEAYDMTSLPNDLQEVAVNFTIQQVQPE